MIRDRGTQDSRGANAVSEDPLIHSSVDDRERQLAGGDLIPVSHCLCVCTLTLCTLLTLPPSWYRVFTTSTLPIMDEARIPHVLKTLERWISDGDRRYSASLTSRFAIRSSARQNRPISL